MPAAGGIVYAIAVSFGACSPANSFCFTLAESDSFRPVFTAFGYTSGVFYLVVCRGDMWYYIAVISGTDPGLVFFHRMRGVMNKIDLRKFLAGLSIASLIAGAGLSVSGCATA